MEQLLLNNLALEFVMQMKNNAIKNQSKC